MNLRRLAPVLPVCALCAATLFCEQQAPEPPPQVVQEYQQQAQAYCSAILECMEADVKTRLADKPERRDMLLDRMNRDLCLKGQFQLLGKLSVDPSGTKKPYDPAHYQVYGQCVTTVTTAETCAARMSAHKQASACQQLRAMQ